MANPSHDDGHPIVRRSSEPVQVQDFLPKSASVSLLRIGQYQIGSRDKTHVTAKWYYGVRQLSWEILEDGLMKKIKIDWSNISAIRVDYRGHQILEIEFKLHSKKRVSWNPISDFTGDQASTYRIHHVEFFDDAPLEENMDLLFIMDSRLEESTKKPFPTLATPFFVDLELRLGRSPRNEMNQVDTGLHLGLASSSSPHGDLALGLPSSSSYRLTTSDRAGRPPDDEGHGNRSNEQLVMMTSNEPRTNDVNAHDSYDGPTCAALVSNPHQD